MNFQDLKKIENYQFYLDVAFRRATKGIDDLRGKTKERDRLSKSKQLELTRIEIINSVLTEQLGKILRSYPSLDQLDEFYQELIRCTLDYKDVKQSLGAVKWAIGKINELFRIYKYKILRAADFKFVNKSRIDFYGRVSSVLRQIKKNLEYLEVSRREMKNYPSVKTSMYTICIFGFPNVGKSTLLKKLTGAEPEINSYAFTTKSINLGYIKEPLRKIQFIDTPGTLNRLNKMNQVEMQAYLAVKYLANVIIYVFDPTLEYSIKDQAALLRKLKEFDKEIILYISKTDVADKKIVKAIKEKFNALEFNKLKLRLSKIKVS